MIYIVLEDDITSLHLSNRTINCLKRSGIFTVDDLLNYSEEKLKCIRNMGPKTIIEIQEMLSEIKNDTRKYCIIKSRDDITERLQEDINSEVLSEINSSTVYEITSEKNSSYNYDEDMLYLTEEGEVLHDLSIDKISLSVRAINGLKRSNISKVSQLIGITAQELLEIENMGINTVNEIIKQLNNLKYTYVQNANDIENIIFLPNSELIVELIKEYGQTEQVWLRNLITLKAEFPSSCGETIIYRLYEKEEIRKKVKETLIHIIEEHTEGISRGNLENYLPHHLKNTTIADELLLELEQEDLIIMGEVLIRRKYPSIIEFASQIQDDRVKDCIFKKLAGKTLDEIGKIYNLTRERTRQIIVHALRTRPRLYEDKYLSIFEKYCIFADDFVLAFEESETTYNYLELVGQTKVQQKLPLKDLLEDDTISLEVKRRVEKAIYKNYIVINGVRLKVDRSELTQYYIKNNCKLTTKIDDVVEQYHIFLRSLNLQDEELFWSDNRSFENKMNRSDYILWSRGKCIRYYHIEDRDYTDLLETLKLKRYKNVELSTLKWFRDYSDLMIRYDIRDEYELHNLLKKILADVYPQFHFKKMPTIEIGNANPEDQILTLLIQYAPISADDLAEKYEEEYGVKAMSLRGGVLQKFNEYYYDGIYSIDYKGLSYEQREIMNKILDKDFYTITEVKQLFYKEFPGADITVINPYTLKTLGFHVYPGYVGYIVRNTYSGATYYFNELLTKDDIVDMRDYDKILGNIVTYRSELYRIRNDYEIIEFSPWQYINIRRLNEYGVTKQTLIEYSNAISNFTEKGEYFTIKSIHQDGFSHSLDDLGFDEWFYSSVLVEQPEKFSSQRLGGTRLFFYGKTTVTIGDMLYWLLEKYQKIDIYDLVQLLENRYGIMMSANKLREIIKETELYYDTIMEAVYIDYDTYFEEI